MHELSLMNALLERACEAMHEAGAARIVRVEVEVGALCQIVPEVWEMAFEAARPGTPLADATLVWQLVPARVACPACATNYHPTDVLWVCPACGAPGGEAIAGDDIVLTRIEVAEAATVPSG